MIQMDPARFVNAATKARQVKLYVRMMSWRKYGCRTPQGHVYTVYFESRAGRVHASCNCAAGAKNMPCYHVAACYPVDVAVVSMRMEHVRHKEEEWHAKQPCAICKTAHPNKPACDVRRLQSIPPAKAQPPSLGRIQGYEL